MPNISSREKAVYWALIILIAVGGGAGLAYFFISGQKTQTSVVDLATSTVRTQSLVDIVANTDNDAGTKPGPISANNATNTPGGGPIFANNGTQTNRVNQVITAEPQTNRVNQVITAEPRVNRQNQVLSAGPVTAPATATSTTASGSAVPTEPPETGADVLLLSGLASLGISGAASALVLRRGRKRSTRAQ